MYSPKIKEDLVPIIYQKAKLKGITMTNLVDRIIRSALNDDKLDRKEGLKNEKESRMGKF
jgi:hypothetical protein